MLNLKNRKGLSEVVTTLIIVLLVIVAISIIWVVVFNIINQGKEGAENQFNCIGISIKATNVAAVSTTGADVTLRRDAGGVDEIGGVKLVFKNSASASGVLDVPGNIEPLAIITKTVTYTGLTANPTSVEVTPYLVGGKLCTQSTVFEEFG